MTKKLHYFSGITISVFVAIHLVNHLMLFQSEQAHMAFMTVARKFYRNPFCETLLLIAIITQVVSGIQLVKNKWKIKQDIFDRLQIYSGLFLSYFLTVHVSSVLVGRYVLKLDTNLYFGAGVLNNNPALFYFIFHYGLAVISFFIHIACMHKMKISKYPTANGARLHAYNIIGIGCIISFLLLFKMIGLTIPTEYQFLPFGKY